MIFNVVPRYGFTIKLSDISNTNNLLPSKTCDIRLRYLYFCDFAYNLNISPPAGILDYV
jgi:hypothetical protein